MYQLTVYFENGLERVITGLNSKSREMAITAFHAGKALVITDLAGNAIGVDMGKATNFRITPEKEL